MINEISLLKMLKKIYRYFRILLIRLLTIINSDKHWQLPDSILILAPHPDDEIFGCAGLIQRCLQENKPVYVVVLTDGDDAYKKSLIDRDLLVIERQKLTLNAGKIVGLPVENNHFLHWEDRKIKDSFNRINEIQNIIDGIQPAAVFAPHPFEGWKDHVATAKIARKLFPPEKTYYYCVWLWYSMPTSKIWLLNWKKSLFLQMNRNEHTIKKQAIEAYIQPKTAFGQPFSGILPDLFLKANRWNKELFFRSKNDVY